MYVDWTMYHGHVGLQWSLAKGLGSSNTAVDQSLPRCYYRSVLLDDSQSPSRNRLALIGRSQ